LKIALDFDGVLAYTQEAWVHHYNNSEYCYEWIDDPNQFKKWNDMLKFVTAKEMAEIFDKCWERWEELRPMEYSLGDTTKELSKEHNVDIVTCANKEYRGEITRWLGYRGVQYETLVFTNRKWSLPYELFIDDSPIVARELERYKGDKQLFLYDHPWNRSYDIVGTYHARRIYNLRHALDILEGSSYEY